MIRRFLSFILAVVLVVTISPTWVAPTFAVSTGGSNLVAVTKRRR